MTASVKVPPTYRPARPPGPAGALPNMPVKKKAAATKSSTKTTNAKTTTKKSPKSKSSSAKKKASPKKKSASKTKAGDQEVTIDRRRQADRRDASDEQAANPIKPERREKVQRRRQIDPTTCERDYSDAEVEFMNAMDLYKRTSGRMFPTCSEVLEVIRGLGYVQLTPAELATVRPEEVATDQMTEEQTSEELEPVEIG